PPRPLAVVRRRPGGELRRQARGRAAGRVRDGCAHGAHALPATARGGQPHRRALGGGDRRPGGRASIRCRKRHGVLGAAVDARPDRGGRASEGAAAEPPHRAAPRAHAAGCRRRRLLGSAYTARIPAAACGGAALHVHFHGGLTWKRGVLPCGTSRGWRVSRCRPSPGSPTANRTSTPTLATACWA